MEVERAARCDCATPLERVPASQRLAPSPRMLAGCQAASPSDLRQHLFVESRGTGAAGAAESLSHKHTHTRAKCAHDLNLESHLTHLYFIFDGFSHAAGRRFT